MKCQECGAQVQPGKQFCPNCGAKVIAAANNVASFIPQAGARIDLPDPAVSYTGQGKSGLKYQLIGTTLPAVTTQERWGSPSTKTVQAPQSAMPQPYFVPVSPSRSRRAQRRGMSSGRSTVRSSPLMRSVTSGMGSFLAWRVQPGR